MAHMFHRCHASADTITTVVECVLSLQHHCISRAFAQSSPRWLWTVDGRVLATDVRKRPRALAAVKFLPCLRKRAVYTRKEPKKGVSVFPHPSHSCSLHSHNHECDGTGQGRGSCGWPRRGGTESTRSLPCERNLGRLARFHVWRSHSRMDVACDCSHEH